MSNVSLERYYFVLYDGALTLKMSKKALNAFCDKTLQLYFVMYMRVQTNVSSNSSFPYSSPPPPHRHLSRPAPPETHACNLH